MDNGECCNSVLIQCISLVCPLCPGKTFMKLVALHKYCFPNLYWIPGLLFWLSTPQCIGSSPRTTIETFCPSQSLTRQRPAQWFSPVTLSNSSLHCIIHFAKRNPFKQGRYGAFKEVARFKVRNHWIMYVRPLWCAHQSFFLLLWINRST